MAQIGIRTKIQFLVIMVILLPALAIGTYLYVDTETILANQVLAKQEGLFIQVTERVNQLFIGCRNDLNHLASLPLIVDYCLNKRYGLNEEALVVRTQLEELFGKMLAGNKAYHSVSFRSPDGTNHLIVANSQADDHELSICMSSETTYSAEGIRFIENFHDKLPVYAYEAKVLNPSEKNLLAIVTIIIRPKAVTDVIRSASAALRGGSYGLVSSDKRVIFGQQTNSLKKPISAYRYELTNGWAATLDVDYAYLMAPLGNFRRRALLYLAIALVVGLVLSAMGAKRITDPLVKMGLISTRIAKGDFEPPSHANSSMDYEVQQLWENMHDMAASLMDYKDRIEAYISELKTTQNQLVHAEKLSALGLLVAGVAHELNNPMSGLVSSARVIEKSLTRDEPNMGMATKHTGLILLHLQHMQGIVRALHDYSRYSETQPTMTLDLNNIISDALLIIQHQTKRRKFESELSATKPIAGDPVSLKQVVVNLIVNAAEATEPGEAVSVRCWDDTFLEDDIYFTGYSRRRRNDNSEQAFYRQRLLDGVLRRTKAEGVEPGAPCVCMSVFDEGEGIEPDVFLRIFDPFFTTKPEGQGTGLGLSVVLGIVESHRGVIRVDSHKDKGTTFILKFPVVLEQGGEPS